MRQCRARLKLRQLYGLCSISWLLLMDVLNICKSVEDCACSGDGSFHCRWWLLQVSGAQESDNRTFIEILGMND